jgi:hypothetical protein
VRDAATSRGDAMARENVFHVEKHANDALHNPPKRGRTHTVREIEAAARALGRATTKDDDGDGDGDGDGVAAGDVVVVDGCVVRVDATRKRSTKTTRARESALATSGALGKGKRRALAEEDRWKTMSRIESGGTAGAAALREARRATLGLSRGVCGERGDDDGPVVVPEGDLRFVDGWAVGRLDGAAEGSETVTGARSLDRSPDGVAVKSKSIDVSFGRAKKKRRDAGRVAETTTTSRRVGGLSFDVEED